MCKVKCDHCGSEINKVDSVKCEWKEINTTWYYCKRCDVGVFGGRKNKRKM